MRYWHLAVIPAFLLAACEDGPEQVFTPLEGDLDNGYGADAPKFTQEGNKTYETEGGGSDAAGRGLFCDEDERTALIEQMVVAPIIPDLSVGGVPLWAPDGSPMLVDDLFGRPEDGGFCEPVGPIGPYYGYYLYFWGPTNEIVVTFNWETRLIEGFWLLNDYLGTMSGSYTRETVPVGEDPEVDIVAQLKNRLSIGGVALDTYPQWVEPENLNAMHRMIRESFFEAPPFPDSHDCLASGICDVIYADDPSNPSRLQTILIIFRDSGVMVAYAEDGYILEIDVDLVRIAPFELDARIDFDVDGLGSMNMGLQSSCSLRFGDAPAWQQFTSACIDTQRVLDRATYNTSIMRDSVYVGFNGVELGFKRDLTPDANGNHAPIILDGERPADDDELFYMNITRSLAAPIEEFVPSVLGASYATRVEAMLAESVSGGYCDNGGDCPNGGGWSCNANRCENSHPFFSYAVQHLGDLDTTPQAMDKVVYTNNLGEVVEWIPEVRTDIQLLYSGLNAAEQAQVIDLDVFHPATFVHPFVDATIEAFSYSASSTAAFRETRSTDDRRWSVGYAHFELDGEQYRMTVQYSLNYGAVTSVTISRGTNVIDTVIMKSDRPTWPYWEISEAVPGSSSSYAIGGSGLTVHRGSANRQLNTIDVDMVRQLPGMGNSETITLPLAGFPYEDNVGYTRQIRGERFEFIPADKVYLYGQENALVVYVEPDGLIGRVSQGAFKGALTFCQGPTSLASEICAAETVSTTCGMTGTCFWKNTCHALCSDTSQSACETNNCFWHDGACGAGLDLKISYGQPVRNKIDAWVATLDAWQPGGGLEYFRRCDIVYNYSENGNVLDAVASLRNRVSFVTSDGVATQAALWR